MILWAKKTDQIDTGQWVAVQDWCASKFWSRPKHELSFWRRLGSCVRYPERKNNYRQKPLRFTKKLSRGLRPDVFGIPIRPGREMALRPFVSNSGPTET